MALAALCVLAACAKTPADAPASTTSGSGKVGYVHMNDLVKHHPLYPQLAQYNDSIAALNLNATVPQVAASNPELAKQEAELQKELETAATRTKTLLDEKSKEYQQKEAQAIAQALRASGSAPGAGAIAQQINTTARGQSQSVVAAAQSDFNAYRKALDAQDTAELQSAQKAITDRATRSFRAKQDELQAKEAALTLDLANKDAAERLSLRTRLGSLALDDADRAETKAKLDAIDRREADVVGAMKNRDQATLAALNTQLRAHVKNEMAAKENDVRSRSIAKLRTREADIRKEFGSGQTVATTVAGGRPASQVNPNLPPAVRARIVALHDDYQKQFDHDAKSTIDDFNATRLDLKRRYDQLHGLDSSARGGAVAEIASLSKKRDDLYGQIVAQIGREVRLIAQQKGVSVVVTDPVAGVVGVDLTPDAMKDIESLHE